MPARSPDTPTSILGNMSYFSLSYAWQGKRYLWRFVANATGLESASNIARMLDMHDVTYAMQPCESGPARTVTAL